MNQSNFFIKTLADQIGNFVQIILKKKINIKMLFVRFLQVKTSLKTSFFKDFIKYLNIETISMFKNKPTLQEILCRYDQRL